MTCRGSRINDDERWHENKDRETKMKTVTELGVRTRGRKETHRTWQADTGRLDISRHRKQNRIELRTGHKDVDSTRRATCNSED